MTSLRRGALVLLAFSAVATWLHLRAGLTFPAPWVDEVDFLAPAQALARHGTLGVPSLSAPSGLFWVSDLYYFALAPVLRFLPATVTVGRGVSFGFVLLAATGFWTAGRRAGVHPVVAAALAGVWLVTPRVVVAGNMARHEALVFAAIAWALAALVSERRLGALTAAVLAAALHPGGAPFALVIGLAALVMPGKRPSRWEWAGAGLLGAVLSFEVVHFAQHWSLASEQLRFQFHRKAGREVPRIDVLFVPALATSLIGVVRARPRAERIAAVFVACAVAGEIVNSFGREIWYGVYGLPTATLLLGMAFVLVAPRLRSVALPIAQVATVGFVVLFTIAVSSFHLYDMRMGDSGAEWSAFVGRVQQRLDALDTTVAPGTTVVINDKSGLPWPLAEPKFDNITVVKETMVTRATTARYEIVCCRSFVTADHPVGEVIATVTSASGKFEGELVKIAPASVGTDEVGQLLP